MRSRRATARYPTLLVLLLLSVVSAACNVRDDYRFASGGIGTELHTGGIAQRYHVGEMYFGYLCGKANLPTVDGASVGGLPVCSYGEFFELDWNRMVQAGLNDIDTRCDAYLAWQDERKRLGPARVAQLNTTSQFVQAIIGIYEPTALAIRVVSHAFGFATASFENYNQRLLYQIDTSTLQSLVITRQQTFRTQLVEKGVSFNGKPSVEHGLRSYLRICMPMTIETEINNVLTIVDRTGSAPRENLITVDSSVAATKAGRAFTHAEPFRPRATTGPAPAPEARKIFIPKNYFDVDLRQLQDALCVPSAKHGTVDQQTFAKLIIFEDYMGSLPNIVKDGKVSNDYEFERAVAFGPCDEKIYKNAYEREAFADSGRLKSFAEALVEEKEKIPGLAVPADVTLPSLRSSIALANKSLAITLPAGADDDELTPGLARNLAFPIQPRP